MNGTVPIKFRPYVAGDGPHSTQPMAKLAALCHQRLAERHEIEVIDILRDKQRAMTEGGDAEPLVVKYSPAQTPRIGGALSWEEPVLTFSELPI